MNKKGTVLMITMWILAILVIIAIGLGHNAALSLRLARYQRDRLKAYYLAKAGINKAIAILEEDINDPKTKDYDTIQECGVALNGKEAKDIFRQEWANGTESFSIAYYNDAREFVFGLKDEESKININGSGNFDKNKISALLRKKEIEDADKLTDTILDWIKSDSKLDIAKKEALKAPEELLVILEYVYQQEEMPDYKQKARAAFEKVKDAITTYGENKINLNTASGEVLITLFDACVQDMQAKGESGLPGPQDIQGLSEAIDNYRNGGGYFVAGEMNDAGSVKTKLGLAGEINNQTRIIDRLRELGALTAVSQNYKIESIGRVGNITKKIIAVYHRGPDPKNRSIAHWHEN